MAAPQWARSLVQRVASDYEIEAPDLTWRRSRSRTYSSGHFNRYSKDDGSTVTTVGRDGKERKYEGWAPRPRIVVTAGRSREDQKQTVLHEMAHAITTNQPWLLHGAEFYAVLGELIVRYGGTLKYLRFRESRNARAIKEGLRLMRARRAAGS